jgi:hypothetical protein
MALGYGKLNLIREIIKQNWGTQKINFSEKEVLYILQEALVQEGKPYFEEDNSNYGYNNFRNFAKHLLYRNCANFDSMVLITAEKGMGKSSAAMMLAREWCRLIGIKFDPKKHIAYSNADLQNKIDTLPNFSPIISDESVRFASSSDWNKSENKELKKKLAQIRTKHLLFILCFPLKITKLEKNYLDSFVNYWTDIYTRGNGAIFVKDKNPTEDSWRMKEFERVGSYTEFTDVLKIKEMLKKHPNFWTLIRFPKPPEWLYKKYVEVREKNVYDDDNVLKNVNKDDIYRALAIISLRDIMLQDSSININRILLHIKNTYDVNMPKQALQSIIEDAKQLVVKVREGAISL